MSGVSSNTDEPWDLGRFCSEESKKCTLVTSVLAQCCFNIIQSLLLDKAFFPHWTSVCSMRARKPEELTISFLTPFVTFIVTASEEHRCSKLCHHGPCGTCDKKTLLKCRCRATDKVCTVHVGVYVWVYKHCFVEMINKWSSSILLMFVLFKWHFDVFLQEIPCVERSSEGL